MSDYGSIQFQTGGRGTVFGVRVKPAADQNKLVGPYGDRLKVTVQEPASNGQANRCLKNWFSDLFRCSTEHIEIISGANSSDKRVRILGRTPDEIRSLLKQNDPS